jgi:Lanthionine synthetase C-like protein
MLYRAELFEQLTDEPWREDRVRERIRAIVADAEKAYSTETFWPADEWDGWQAPLPLQNLYVGAAGVLWALDVLRRRGHADGELDLAAAGQRLVERWRVQPDFMQGEELPEPRESGLLTGGSGVVLVAWRLAPSDELADDLLARVRANKDNAANEVMWGSPGTMLAARAMYDWTGDERWAYAWRESADALLARRDADGLWSIALYGQTHRGMTPPHGVVGNVGALLDGGELLPAETHDTLKRDTNTILARKAFRENGLTNWPHPADRGTLEDSQGEIRLQWCFGAPGTVIAAADYLNEELLLAGAELTWRAGPHGMEKGSGICHGTAGNGYALLKTFARTGDERWLDRARRFAVHALEQVERRGTGRYSLFTGDVGVALFAADCLYARGAYPITDTRG